MSIWLGIDVGTGSARAGLFDATGKLLATDQHPIRLWRPQPDFAQQSSTDIWAAIIHAVKGAMKAADIAPEDVGGIGFDATCSLVTADASGAPVTISPDGASEQNVIVWMDHRALQEADDINATGGEPLAHVGGVISPEMEIPKLLWLKRHLPESFAKAALFFDLPDWLVYRATGAEHRSLCSAVCKWTYLGHKGLSGEGWDDPFLTSIGLEDLTGSGHSRIGTSFQVPGEKAGGLSEQAARELGLVAGTPVGASLIDAHAGALGTLGAGGAAPDGRLAVIAGTSACHIALSAETVFVPGVWGPYFGAVTPGMWCSEGGQSAAGAVIDTLLDRQAAMADIRQEAKAKGISPYVLMAGMLKAAAGDDDTAFLTRSLHVQPDLHGNRSPLAEPWRHGGIDGLTLAQGQDYVVRLYLATLQALAYGTRHIVEAMGDAGLKITALVLSGGLAKNPQFLRELADACQIEVLVPDVSEPVLLGSAMLGAVAAGAYATGTDAMQALAPEVHCQAPRGGEIAAYHERKYQVFRRMQTDHAAYAEIMKG